MTEERGLTWSKKWHIIDQARTRERDGHGKRYGVSICGSYVYLDDDSRYPAHLKAIRDGKAKDAGVCKRCLKQTKVTTVTVELPELVSDDYHEGRWEVPLYNEHDGVIGVPRVMYVGEVWVKYTGVIAVSSVPTPLPTAGDARRLAAALLAAADWVDKNMSQS